jgi:hypothetical protein
MSQTKGNTNRQWSSSLMFFAAAIGSAVGISNIWKFTYVAGENGGGAFVLVYVLAIAFVALPALTAEFLIGRRGGASVEKTMDNLSRDDGISRAWRYYGLMAVTGAFLALSFYSVVAGWTIDYFFQSISRGFDGETAASAESGPHDGLPVCLCCHNGSSSRCWYPEWARTRPEMDDAVAFWNPAGVIGVRNDRRGFRRSRIFPVCS